jgi:uncharacterized membrane protein (UPF0127 family)
MRPARRAVSVPGDVTIRSPAEGFRMIRSFASRLSLAVAGALLLLAALLSPLRAAGRPMILPTDPAPLVIHTAKGPQSFRIEIAETADEAEAGLMHRKTMGDRHGMLFLLGASGIATFWMKDTPMPLDLVFIGEKGKIRAIKQGVPYSTALISPKVPVRFVLELKAGTAKKNGIAVGNRVSHPAIAKIAHGG